MLQGRGAPIGGAAIVRLARLAEALELLAGRWRRESADPRVALILRARFGSAAAELALTRDAVAGMLAAPDADRSPARDTLGRLHHALAALADLAVHVPQADAASAVTDIRSRARAVRLEVTTRKLLKRLGRTLAVGALGAAALASAPVAAADCTGVASVICTGDIGPGVVHGPPVTNLTVQAPTANAAPAAGTPGVELNGDGAQGGDGSDETLADGGDADGGGAGAAITLSVNTGALSISTTGVGGYGVFGHANGGHGGEGGDSDDIDAQGGDGGVGGDAGSVTIITAGHIQTAGLAAHGVFGLSAAGNGGNGGDAAGLNADGGDGARGGVGGSVNIANAAAVTTSGDAAQGLFGQSLGGSGGNGGNGSGIVGGGGSGATTSNGGSVIITSGGAIVTTGNNAAGIFGQSVGGYGGSGGSGSGLFAYGGDGTTAGGGGVVDVSNQGSIYTTGVRSFGVFGQSVGGGGGAGGSGGGLVGLGSTGEAGGSGGSVTVGNTGTILTEGIGAIGLYGQSIGGGGGDGGSGSGLVGIGGGGSGTSGGGAVMGTNSGAITTYGDNAQGVFVQSIGGGGGNGGAGAGLFSLGGDGGGGGPGGDVTATNSGNIYTHGYDSYAIFAQSVGGGGGNGAESNGWIAIGGAGAGGGAGGAVSVTNSGIIQTYADGSGGVFAQSVGGGGGNGGDATSGGLFVSVAVGGSGGEGSAGGLVTVANTGSIVTFGEQAAAIFAQSVGGGGGNGGFGQSGAIGLFGSVSVSVGGEGGGGGVGGEVHVIADGVLTTHGADSRGVFAQSVGGGGGNGGYTVAASLALGPGVAVGGSVSVGGDGGAGGDGGDVTVDYATGMTINTSGARSAGIFAQSVGGGGGNGGWSGAIAVAGSAGVSGAVGVAVGGGSGDGGVGGDVSVAVGGLVHTRGVDSAGVFAQSIGGGGGTGGYAWSGAGAAGSSGAASVGVGVGGSGGGGGDAGDVTVSNNGTILTDGDRSSGVYAQAVGGGGGAGGWTGTLALAASQTAGAVGVSVGGSGGDGGLGGVVEVETIGDITTLGVDAHGILAQSIGGGGGSGGFSLAAGAAAGSTAIGGSVSVGGSGAGGGAADTVTVTVHGGISTTGDRSAGVYAQSVGGGGGNGGWSGSLGVGVGSTAGGAGVSVGGSAGVGGTGDDVTVHSSGPITTRGVDASGILAQSIGGGGGTGGFSAAAGLGAGKTAGGASVSIGGSGGAGGGSGTVDVESTGQITTFGDRSYAIQAQSIGGGGGSGGFAGALSAAFSSGTPVSIGAAFGGSGGDGGDAGDVIVLTAGGASTFGASAHAVFAQSVGGGGGSGGMSISGALSAGKNTIGLSGSFGGSGGVGGDAGDVSVTSQGLTVTRGDFAFGVFAQSVGGGGGDGGFSGTLTGGLGSKDSISFGLSMGGSGGAAGDGGDVTVVNNGQIVTFGSDAFGVFGQSIGGGGGTGGMAVTATVGGTKATNVSLAFGGTGGAGGAAGDVGVTNTNRIATYGGGAIGVFAQSTGGGGGAGGAAGALAASGSESVNLSLNMGGEGGTGSVGGDVTVTNSGVITTEGELAYGVFAQSIGGGGGHGGMAGIDETQWSDYLAGGAGTVSLGSKSKNISVALGGDGGSGNHSGDVTVTNAGSITTTGVQAAVIFAQATGGGGGDAGVATAASGSFGGSENGNYSVAIGGTGAAAGDGGNVLVNNSGVLRSTGDGSAGITAQSVGGGGGAGGDARGYAIAFTRSESTTEPKSTTYTLSLGGEGGAAGDGGIVTVINTGRIVTDGAYSFGIFAESIGGGGGFGGRVSTQGADVFTFLDLANKGESDGRQIAIGGDGAGGGDGGAVLVTNSGLIQTSGTGAHAVFAQSVGGGGGDGGSGLAGDVSVGGDGGVSGDGGAVTVSNTGTIRTYGVIARGIFAQSVGGGGGTGGATDYDGDAAYSYHQGLSDSMTVINNILGAKDLVESFKEPAWGIGIGGSGGAAGNGGAVSVTNVGSIQTAGDLSHGIFAQSVGGGGGTGGEGTITSVGQLVFSGSGGSAGDGGDVTVTNTGLIQTAGFGAYGIFAQSVGGGGGVAGDTSLGIASWGDLSVFGGEDYSDFGSLQINPLDGFSGVGGDVTVVNTGDIILLGDGSVGIFAQSIGGGGGLFGSGIGLSFAGSMGGVGDSGTVTIIQTGNVYAGGKNGVGAFFQSHAGNGSSARNISATVNGDVRGGAVFGKGVLVEGGATNIVTLNGVVSAGSSLAIVATFGDDTFISRKGVIGNVDLGLGANAFNNTSTSTFETLDYVRLNGGLLTNDGVLTPGGAGLVQTTQVTGGLKQTVGATFLTDLDLLRTGLSREIDQLTVSGAADLKGRFVLGILNPGYVRPGDHTATIISAGGSLTTSDLTLDAPVSAIASFALEATAHELNLNYVVDFSPAGFNANRTSVGDYINTIQTAGSSPGFAPVAAQLFYEPSPAALARYYDTFSPEAYGDQAAVTTYASDRFADAMMSCPVAPGRPQGSDQGCVWARISTRSLTLDATAQDQAFRERSRGLSFGVEAAPAEGWRVGAAASAESVDTGLTPFTSGDGERYQFGVTVKRLAGPFTLALAAGTGVSDLETRRYVLLPGGQSQAQATQTLSFQALTARASWRLGSDSFYARPMVEVSRMTVDTDGFTETGAGALNLVVPGQSSDTTRASFKVELGGEFSQGGNVARPYARVGVSSLVSGAESPFTAGFQAAPGGVNPFDVTSRLDKTTFDAELGVTAVSDRGSARLGWSGQFGDRIANQTFAIKLTVAF
mgnify:CR=1 FL=1